MDVNQEMLNAELRKARGWLIGVGVLMFVIDMVMIHAIYEVPMSYGGLQLTLMSGGVLAVFLVLAYFVKKKPRLCLSLGLVAFWGLQLYNASIDPSSLAKGIPIKILFTLALVKGLQSASRAETMIRDLEKVFE